MPNIMYNEGKRALIAGASNGINFATDTIKAMLVGSGYVANADNTFVDAGGANDPVDHRIAGTTDQTLTNPAIVRDDTGDFACIDADDVTWANVAAGTGEGVVIYKSTGTPTLDRMICYLDINVVANGGNITAQFAAPASGGIAKMS